MTQQIPLRDWPQGLEQDALHLSLLPNEIERRSKLKFERDHDDLDDFEGAVVTLDNGKFFALQHHLNSPVPGTTVLLERGATEGVEDVIRLLRLERNEIIWAASHLEAAVKEATRQPAQSAVFSTLKKSRVGSRRRVEADTISVALEEAGQRAAALAQNPIARSLLAAGLVTAAAALAAQKTVRNSARRSARRAQETAESAVDAAAESASKIGAEMINAATDAVRKMMANGRTDVATESAVTPKSSSARASRGQAAAKSSGNRPKRGGHISSSGVKSPVTSTAGKMRESKSAVVHRPRHKAGSKTSKSPRPVRKK